MVQTNNHVRKRHFISVDKLEPIIRSRTCGLSDAQHNRIIHEIMEEVMTVTERRKADPPPEGTVTLNQAERRFGISNVTLHRWVKYGILKPVKKTSYATYVDEIQVKYLIEKYKQDPGRGKRTISKNDADM